MVIMLAEYALSPGVCLDTESGEHLPYSGGGLNTSYSGGCAILHTPTNFWTTGDTELKFYMVIDIHELFSKIEKELSWILLIMHLLRHDYANFNII